MRERDGQKKTRRWPPRVGKRHRQQSPAPPQADERASSSKQHPPGEDNTPAERSAEPEPAASHEPVVMSRRNRLRQAVARRRIGSAAVSPRH